MDLKDLKKKTKAVTVFVFLCINQIKIAIIVLKEQKLYSAPVKAYLISCHLPHEMIRYCFDTLCGRMENFMAKNQKNQKNQNNQNNQNNQRNQDNLNNQNNQNNQENKND